MEVRSARMQSMGYSGREPAGRGQASSSGSAGRRKVLTLDRLAGVGAIDGSTMVWHQWFWCYRFLFYHFNWNANKCSDRDAYNLWCIRTAYFCRIRSMHVHVAKHVDVASLAMETGERTTEDQRSHVRAKRSVWKKILLD